jgi:hypothetical protein
MNPRSDAADHLGIRGAHGLPSHNILLGNNRQAFGLRLVKTDISHHASLAVQMITRDAMIGRRRDGVQHHDQEVPKKTCAMGQRMTTSRAQGGVHQAKAPLDPVLQRMREM